MDRKAILERGPRLVERRSRLEDSDDQSRVLLTEQPTTLTQIQICRRIGVCVQTWRNWRRLGIAPQPIEMGRRPRWRLADIEKLERGHLVKPGRKMYLAATVRRRPA
jgi:hypothetical protein